MNSRGSAWRPGRTEGWGRAVERRDGTRRAYPRLSREHLILPLRGGTVPRPLAFLRKTVRFFMSSRRIQLSQDMLLAAFGDTWSAEDVSAAAELLAGGEGRFPSGIRSLPSALVKAVQHERLIAATLRAAA